MKLSVHFPHRFFLKTINLSECLMQFPYLSFIESLQPSDLGWIDANAEILNLRPHDLLISEGSSNSDLYILETGLLSVYTGDSDDGENVLHHEIARIGAGSLVGDLSWLETQVTSASVSALENSLILRVDGAALEEKIAADSEFAARFLHGIARLIAQRLRETTNTLTRYAANASRIAVESEPANLLLGEVEDFKSLLMELDRQLIAAPDAHIDAKLAELQPAFQFLLLEFNALMSTALPVHVRADVGAIVQREMLPYISLASVTERLYAKPRGYAGDFQTVDLLYRNEAGGHGRLGPLVDRCFLDEPAAKAIRNRRAFIAADIRARAADAGALKVTSLACGAAQEIRDVFHAEPNAQIRYTAIDIDNEALESVQRWADATAHADLIQPIQANLVYLTTGRQELDLTPQDLIYSLAAIDYLNDQFVVKLLDWIHAHLAPNGRVLLGNFHPSNPDKAFMDHVLDWHLIHRDQDELNRLFMASKFGQPCERIVFEEEGVILFAEGVKR